MAARIGALLGSLLLAPTALSAAQAISDTTIDGESYEVVPIEAVLLRLRTALSGSAIELRGAAVRGRLFAPTAGIDTVTASVRFADVHFLDEVSFNGVVFRQPVEFSDCVFGGGLAAFGAVFETDLDMSGCHSRSHLSFKQAQFIGQVDFSDCQFDAVSSFIETRFGAEVSFARARFEDAAYFERAEFEGKTRFDDAFFERRAVFQAAQWRRSADFSGVRFEEQSLFRRAVFESHASFETVRFFNDASFTGATFDAGASFRGATFIRQSRFDRMAARGETSFAASLFRKRVSFRGSRFHGDLVLSGSFMDTLDLVDARGGTADLRLPADELSASRGDSTLRTGGRLLLEGAQFDQLLVRWSQLQGRLAAETGSLADLGPVYTFLSRQFEARGLPDDARQCRVEWMEQQRTGLPWSSARKYSLTALWLTTRYLTDLSRLALFMMGTGLVFSLIYFFSTRITGRPLGFLESAWFSVRALLGTFLPQPRPTGFVRLLALVELLIGWCCLALLVATLVALFAP